MILGKAISPQVCFPIHQMLVQIQEWMWASSQESAVINQQGLPGVLCWEFLDLCLGPGRSWDLLVMSARGWARRVTAREKLGSISDVCLGVGQESDRKCAVSLPFMNWLHLKAPLALMAHEPVILSNWKAPPMCLDLTRAIAKERSARQWGHRGQLVSDWCVHSPGDGNHLLLPAFTVNLGGNALWP